MVLAAAVALLTLGCQDIATYDPVPVSPTLDGPAVADGPVADAASDGQRADASDDGGIVSDARADAATIDAPSDVLADDATVDSSVDGPPADASVDATVDTVVADSTTDALVADTRVDSSAPDQSALPTVMISEIFPISETVADDRGEWFELHNYGVAEISLLNWWIGDINDLVQITLDVRIPAGGYLVLGLNSRPSQNGNLTVDYSYDSKIRFDNDAPDTYRVLDDVGTQVDSVTYDVAGWGITSGHAWSYVGGFSADKNDPRNWCEEMVMWSAPSSDYGTPGIGRECGP